MSEELSEKLPEEEYDLDVDVFITLIEERPVIWDKTLDSYKSRTETSNAWREICVRLNPKFEELGEAEKNKYGKEFMKKWTNIRDRQNKYLKKIKDQTKTGSSAKNAKKYIYSEQLSFLTKTTSLNTTVTSLDETQPYVNEPEERPGVDSDGPTQPKKFNPQPKYSDVEKAIMNKLAGPEDRHLNFFKGIIPSLQLLKDEEVIRFQSGVLNVLQEIHNSRRIMTNSSRWNVQVPPGPSYNAQGYGNFHQQPYPSPRSHNQRLFQHDSPASELYTDPNSSETSPIMDINFTN